MNSTALNNTEVKVNRNMRGELSAETYLPTKKEGYKLRVSTWKRARNVVTHFQATEIKGNIESFVMFQDFSKNINHLEVKRATEKSLKEAHIVGLSKIDEVMKEFNQHYKIEC